MEYSFEHSILSSLEGMSIVAAGVIGFIGVAIMTYGTIKGFGMFLINAKNRNKLVTEIRIDIAKHLSLGLEFLVGKDIIETIVNPTLDRLLVLACIVALRTVIGIILAWEMKGAVHEVEQEREIQKAIAGYEKETKR
jgi:uncharacterized membrane protein